MVAHYLLFLRISGPAAFSNSSWSNTTIGSLHLLSVFFISVWTALASCTRICVCVNSCVCAAASLTTKALAVYSSFIARVRALSHTHAHTHTQIYCDLCELSRVASSLLSFPVLPSYFTGLLEREASTRHWNKRSVYLQPYYHYEMIKWHGLGESQMFASTEPQRRHGALAGKRGELSSTRPNVKQLLL